MLMLASKISWLLEASLAKDNDDMLEKAGYFEELVVDAGNPSHFE